MRRQRSLPSRAAHLVSDITTVLLNPISDKPSKPSPLPLPYPPLEEDEGEAEGAQLGSISDEEGSYYSADSGGPDTSSFTAFLASFLSSSDHKEEAEPEKPESDSQSESESESKPDIYGPEPGTLGRDSIGRKGGLFSRGKQSIGKAIRFAVRIGGLSRNQGSVKKGSGSVGIENNDCRGDNVEVLKPGESKGAEAMPFADLPEMSDPSMLLSDGTRCFIYDSLPSLSKGRKWVLLYSTWRHGISLSTLYRRSKLCSGPSLLVVGDRKGAAFGGLVEAPLRPAQSRKYQGTNSTFLFTDMPGHPVIFRPTGVNRYYTLCSPEFLAMGGGDHFALYLDGDLLNGSSCASETYGNSCLAHSPEFVVKEVELWAFVYASKYEEMLALCREDGHGICRW